MTLISLLERLFFFGVVVLTLLGFLHSELALRTLQTERSIPPLELSVGYLPAVNKVLTEPIFTDIYWIQTVVIDAEVKRRGLNSSRVLIQRGMSLAEMDPLFNSTYEWIPGAFLSRRGIAEERDLLALANLLDVGIAANPGDGYLPFSAAMLFVGHSPPDNEERRRQEISKAISYLYYAEGKPGSHEQTPDLIAGLSRRLNSLQTSDSDQSIASLFLLGQNSLSDGRIHHTDQCHPEYTNKSICLLLGGE